MERPVIIDVSDVYKSFRVYYDKGSMLKEQFVNPGRSRYEEREILKGTSFKVHQGETVALIGQNGCGKSTTLKMITKILYPNKGTVTVIGKVSSLIELGAGFHPDMSGRENIYINAAILGIKKKAVDNRIDEIIRFSELEEFIDNPVRTYSSGMYMRLAFSVAINVDADILLIDEILAVGDQAFQEKCMHKLDELRQSGVTIVLVSHSMKQIKEIAERCIWLENGRIIEDGDTETVCNHYENAMARHREERDELEDEQRRIKEPSAYYNEPKELHGTEESSSGSKNRRKIEREQQRLERQRRQEAFSVKWKGGGTQGKKIAGVCAIFLFMMLAACQSVFGINYNAENELSLLTREVGYLFFILGSVGFPMLLILLGFDLLGRDYSTREKIHYYYLRIFLPVVVMWEMWVVLYQLFLHIWNKRTIDVIVWLKEAMLIKYVDIGNLWTARFFILMMLATPFVARILQLFNASTLRLVLIVLWIFLFMFPGFDLYGQANGGKPSFPFYSGTICYFYYFCVGHMISRYSQRILKGSREVIIFVLAFFLTMFSQIFLDFHGIEYLVKPTYYTISVMAIVGVDILIRIKVDEMFPNIAALLTTAFSSTIGIFFIFGPLQMIINGYLINGGVIQDHNNLTQLISGTLIQWLLAGLISLLIMFVYKKVMKSVTM